MSLPDYVISCYGEDVALFSVPISINKNHMERILGRGEYPINGETLTEAEFNDLRVNVINGVEIGWHPDLKYFLEGRDASK